MYSLVELIVLNIGLQANVLDPKTFSMFVVHALVLTFMTTPLVLLFYPGKHRVHHRTDKSACGEENLTNISRGPDNGKRTRFAVLLDKIEALPATMTFTQLLQSSDQSLSLPSTLSEKAVEAGLDLAHAGPPSSPITVEALRLMELTNRTSAVLRSQEADALIYNDPVVSVYKTFGQLNNLNVSAKLSVVNFDEFPETIANHVSETGSQMLFIPWPRGMTSVLEEENQGQQQTGTRNPFDGIFHKTTIQDQTSSFVYSEFIRNVFARSPSDMALFVDRGTVNAPIGNGGQHLFLPFFGGPDDRLALSFLVQLCERSNVSATVVRIRKTDASHSEEARLGPTSPLASTFNNVSAHAYFHGQDYNNLHISIRLLLRLTPSMDNIPHKLVYRQILLTTSYGTSTHDPQAARLVLLLHSLESHLTPNQRQLHCSG